ncbi:MAG TPA: S8 family serine peptidase [Acidimicrobiales bacterium]|nr:S8 family serine peptidase [Acidimicrobiales bacterium]
MLSRSTAAAVLALGALVASPAAAAGAPAPAATPGAVGGAAGTTGTWIVRSPAGVPAAASAVVGRGGRVLASLDLVGGVAAELSGDAAAALTAAGFGVTPDVALRVASTDAAPTQLAAMDPGALAAPDAGAGVGVALVDTGVDPLPPLAGHLVAGPDLSGEGTPIDHYGHGTFMAGLIAGSGTGSAPGATVVSVKVAGADGSTDVARVIAGIGWVIANRDRYGIRVLSLSLSAATSLAPAVDPVDLAVDAAWHAGITVVAAAGNTAGTVGAPGDDPHALTAGAEGAAAPGLAAAWSGSSVTKPDVLAPGTSVVSLRAPGSTVDVGYPNARVGAHLFRGSGTSMATALLAGGVADLIAAHPSARPDDLAAALVATSGGTPGTDAGPVDLAAADAFLATASHADGAGRPQPAATGVRAGDDPALLTTGSWDPADWTAMRWATTDWTAMRWATTDWTAMRWAADDWSAMRWAAMRWADGDWTAMRWAAMRWSDADWSAMRWSDADWSAMRWSDIAWSDHAWG